MEISKALKLECCSTNLKAENKDDALHQLASLIVNAKELSNISEQTIYESLKEREKMGSTGFGKGIAIPHCQLDNLDSFILGIAVSQHGIPFDTLDKKKAKIFVVILGPKGDRSGHLRLLAKVSSVLKEPGIHDNLIHSESKIALYEEFLRNSENNIHIKQSRGRNKLMLLVVKDESIIEDITEIFLDYNIQNTTIIESQQMENLLSKVPLFMGFFNFTGDKNPYSKIIMAKINKNYITALVKSIEDRFGDLDNYSDLSLMVLDLFYSKG